MTGDYIWGLIRESDLGLQYCRKSRKKYLLLLFVVSVVHV